MRIRVWDALGLHCGWTWAALGLPLTDDQAVSGPWVGRDGAPTTAQQRGMRSPTKLSIGPEPTPNHPQTRDITYVQSLGDDCNGVGPLLGHRREPLVGARVATLESPKKRIIFRVSVLGFRPAKLG